MNKQAYLEEIYNTVFNEEIEKTALNALAKRQLAKQVGLIPEQKSAWQSALRQLRAPSKKGAPVMLEGKALAKKKIQIGTPTNNEMQKLRSAQRKSRQGHENAMTRDGTIVKSKPTEKEIQTAQHHYVDGADIKIHTHPSDLRIGQKWRAKNPLGKSPLTQNRSREQAKNMQDSTLVATPSDIDHGFDPKIFAQRQAAVKKYAPQGRALKSAWTRKINSTKYARGGDRLRSSINTEYRKKIKESNFGQSQKALKGTTKLRQTLGSSDRNELQYSGLKEAIVGSKTTGVHKYNPKFNRGMKSVYFQGGYTV